MLDGYLELKDLSIGQRVRTSLLRNIFGVKIVLKEYRHVPGTSTGEGIIASINDEPYVSTCGKEAVFVFYMDAEDELDYEDGGGK